MLIQLSIPPRTSSSLLNILRGSSPSLSIIPKCLRVLWLKPSVVSGSYTMSCYSFPPILFKFICTVGYAASKSGRPESVLPDLRSGLDSGAPCHSIFKRRGGGGPELGASLERPGLKHLDQRRSSDSRPPFPFCL
jgi:hypothetical protein